MGVACLDGSLLAWDVRSGCPLYGKGPKKAAWRYLEQTLDTLGQAISRDMPEIMGDGWQGYCLMADVIYGEEK